MWKTWPSRIIYRCRYWMWMILMPMELGGIAGVGLLHWMTNAPAWWAPKTSASPPVLLCLPLVWLVLIPVIHSPIIPGSSPLSQIISLPTRCDLNMEIMITRQTWPRESISCLQSPLIMNHTPMVCISQTNRRYLKDRQTQVLNQQIRS